MRLNNKGMSIIEIVITFSLIMFMVIGLFTIVLNYQSKAADTIKKSDLIAFKTSLTKDIQDDISKYGVKEMNEAGECVNLLNNSLSQCINIVFKNDQQKAFGISLIDSNNPDSIKNKFLYYDGIKYKLKDTLPDNIPEGRDILDFQSLSISDGPILSVDSYSLDDDTIVKLYSIDVYISYLDFKDDYGIHITAADKDISTIIDKGTQEDEEKIVIPVLPTIKTHPLVDIIKVKNDIKEITANQAMFPIEKYDEDGYKENPAGLYKLVTEDGDELSPVTYFFRGNVDNYVSFAGFTWRIIRINEDGTIRLILEDGINNSLYAFTEISEDAKFTCTTANGTTHCEQNEGKIQCDIENNSINCYKVPGPMYCGVNIEGTTICSSEPLIENEICEINNEGTEECNTYMDFASKELYCIITESKDKCYSSSDVFTCSIAYNNQTKITSCNTSSSEQIIECETTDEETNCNITANIPIECQQETYGSATCNTETETIICEDKICYIRSENYYSNSTAKNVIEEWYRSNIGNNRDYTNKIANGNYFCQSPRYINYTYQYQYIPDFTCNNDYTIKYFIGLITADEVIFAGNGNKLANSTYFSSLGYTPNNNYYLYNGEEKNFWTITPTDDNNIYGTNTLNIINSSSATEEKLLRPVIILRADVKYAGGNGTKDNPYKLK